MPLVVRCPTCRKETAWENNPQRPFCSERCKVVDLGAWVDERYKISSEESNIDLFDDDDSDVEKKLQ